MQCASPTSAIGAFAEAIVGAVAGGGVVAMGADGAVIALLLLMKGPTTSCCRRQGQIIGEVARVQIEARATL